MSRDTTMHNGIHNTRNRLGTYCDGYWIMREQFSKPKLGQYSCIAQEDKLQYNFTLQACRICYVISVSWREGERTFKYWPIRSGTSFKT